MLMICWPIGVFIVELKSVMQCHTWGKRLMSLKSLAWLSTCPNQWSFWGSVVDKPRQLRKSSWSKPPKASAFVFPEATVPSRCYQLSLNIFTWVSKLAIITSKIRQLLIASKLVEPPFSDFERGWSKGTPFPCIFDLPCGQHVFVQHPFMDCRPLDWPQPELSSYIANSQAIFVG